MELKDVLMNFISLLFITFVFPSSIYATINQNSLQKHKVKIKLNDLALYSYPSSPGTFTIDNPKYREVFDWVNFSYIQQYPFRFITDLSKCKFCNFTPHNENSPPRDDTFDISMTFILGKIAGIVPFVQTLRTTGSKAQMITFVDDATEKEIKEKLGSFMSDCGVHIINMGIWQKRKNRFFLIYYFKYLPEIAFLETHPHFKRVLITDLTDVVFQGNTFLTEIKDENTLIVNPEFEKGGLDMHSWDKGSQAEIVKIMIENQHEIDLKWYQTKARYYNSGVFLASRKTMMYLISSILDLINKVNEEQWNRLEKIKERLEEQNFVIFAINRYLWTNSNYTVMHDGPKNDLFQVWGRKFKKTSFPDFKYKGNFVKLYHLIYLTKQYCRSVSYKCPQLFNFTPYYRC
ncbi:hypothetical protein TRFO_21505 [Tritrichomonas foetus]|uniref:Nucleotide-diphospho-sugar transferase domain-containing protein n=1 Tax=Tritrichomonas foetus TaxID=1144522 RepID=A0A1J4KDU8_9EUKA|nr:hypothetical protein TRFO_21505 [Tritrichomonas foetus]|eukprot:OHT09609.1 hypothetical protein TRFO_21505 [Tritrichomonas foetus]